jgi:DNA topoisomerase IA
MTDKYPDEMFVTDIKGSNGRLWNMPVIGDDGNKSVQYVRGDLISESNAARDSGRCLILSQQIEDIILVLEKAADYIYPDTDPEGENISVDMYRKANTVYRDIMRCLDKFGKNKTQ